MWDIPTLFTFPEDVQTRVLRTSHHMSRSQDMDTDLGMSRAHTGLCQSVLRPCQFLVKLVFGHKV